MSPFPAAGCKHTVIATSHLKVGLNDALDECALFCSCNAHDSYHHIVIRFIARYTDDVDRGAVGRGWIGCAFLEFRRAVGGSTHFVWWSRECSQCQRGHLQKAMAWLRSRARRQDLDAGPVAATRCRLVGSMGKKWIESDV